MEPDYQKSIRNIGQAIAFFSGYMIFSNGLGAAVFLSFDAGAWFGVLNLPDAGFDFGSGFAFMLKNFVALCLIIVAIGTAYMISGIYLRKFRPWARLSVMGISILMFILIWAFMIYFGMTFQIPDVRGFAIMACLFTSALFTTPLALLLVYLNKKAVKSLFV